MIKKSKKSEKVKKTILLVEDEADLREIYETKFKLDGYRVLSADTGAKAIDLALHENPQVILLDVILPGKDGFAVLAELKANEKTKNIPVIIFSNLGQDWEVKKGQSLGAAKFLTKSNVTPAEVARAVGEVLK
jgi:DNA-binding response OmpR family regulator